MDTREAGAKGGRSRSEAKRAAVRQNLEKARAAKRAAAPVAAAPEPQPAPAPEPAPGPRVHFLRSSR